MTPKRRWKRIAGIVLAVMVVTVFLPAPIFHGVWLLLTGWIGFLRRVAGQINFNAEIALSAAVALALAILGLHQVLGWFHRKQCAGSAAARWQLRWTMQITAMVLFLFAASISAIGMVHQIGWFFQTDRLVYNAGIGFATKQASGLKQVALAIRIYAEDHQGILPEHLEEVVPDFLSSKEFLFAAPDGDEPPELISYFRGDGRYAADERIILAGPLLLSARGQWRVIACRDTSAQVVKEERFQQRMAAQRE